MVCMQWGVVISALLVLPACVFQPHKYGTEKPSPASGTGSVFACVTEESVRNEVRATSSLASYSDDSGGADLTLREKHRLTKKLVFERAAERQAALSDIPVPLNVKPLASFFSDSSWTANAVVSLGYKTEQSKEAIVRFYNREMERNGWRLIASGSIEHEAFACFIKPDRFCSLSVRPHTGSKRHKKNHIEFVIFTGPASLVW
jgi:hypothetical protein